MSTSTYPKVLKKYSVPSLDNDRPDAERRCDLSWVEGEVITEVPLFTLRETDREKAFEYVEQEKEFFVVYHQTSETYKQNIQHLLDAGVPIFVRNHSVSHAPYLRTGDAPLERRWLEDLLGNPRVRVVRLSAINREQLQVLHMPLLSYFDKSYAVVPDSIYVLDWPFLMEADQPFLDQFNRDMGLRYYANYDLLEGIWDRDNGFASDDATSRNPLQYLQMCMEKTSTAVKIDTCGLTVIIAVLSGEITVKYVSRSDVALLGEGLADINISNQPYDARAHIYQATLKPGQTALLPASGAYQIFYDEPSLFHLRKFVDTVNLRHFLRAKEHRTALQDESLVWDAGDVTDQERVLFNTTLTICRKIQTFLKARCLDGDVKRGFEDDNSRLDIDMHRLVTELEKIRPYCCAIRDEYNSRAKNKHEYKGWKELIERNIDWVVKSYFKAQRIYVVSTLLSFPLFTLWIRTSHDHD